MSVAGGWVGGCEAATARRSSKRPTVWKEDEGVDRVIAFEKEALLIQQEGLFVLFQKMSAKADVCFHSLTQNRILTKRPHTKKKMVPPPRLCSTTHPFFSAFFHPPTTRPIRHLTNRIERKRPGPTKNQTQRIKKR